MVSLHGSEAAAWGQAVVIVGGGAFACEAMRSAVLNGAASTTMVTRENIKWEGALACQNCGLACISSLVSGKSCRQGPSVPSMQVDHPLLAPVPVQRHQPDAPDSLGVEDGPCQGVAHTLLLQALPPGAPHPHRRSQGHELHRCEGLMRPVIAHACCQQLCSLCREHQNSQDSQLLSKLVLVFQGSRTTASLSSPGTAACSTSWGQRRCWTTGGSA